MPKPGLPEPVDVALVPAPEQHEKMRYRAFLSYAHADVRWATWLHGRLEAFRIDKDLVGRATPLGPVPRTLWPIFRDSNDFSGCHTLGDATIAALDSSAALIVLCSPVAATRQAVNEEVRLFKQRHPDRPVIPVIVAGRPFTSPLAGEVEESAAPAVRSAGGGNAIHDGRARGYGETVVQDSMRRIALT